MEASFANGELSNAIRLPELVPNVGAMGTGLQALTGCTCCLLLVLQALNGVNCDGGPLANSAHDPRSAPHRSQHDCDGANTVDSAVVGLARGS